VRLNLRVKLALVSLVLLVLPWAGYRYVVEVERFLLASQEQALLSTAKAVATALHERPRLMRLSVPKPVLEPPPEVVGAVDVLEAAPAQAVGSELEAKGKEADKELSDLLRGAQRSDARLWVVNRELRVLALAGSLKSASPPPPAWRRWLAWLIPPPAEDFDDAFDEDALINGREVTEALLGAGATRVRKTRDGRAVVVSAAYPVWAGDDVVGALVAEATTNPIISVRSEALGRLAILTLAVVAAVAIVLLGFASRLSARIRRLADEAEGAIDARGRISGLLSGSTAGDEIGDLSRSFSTVLARLVQHHAYLDSLASRLSHELRTPIAVVRSSLENLRLEGVDEQARVYVDRAEEGLGRLSRILSRMAEATRLEASLATQERERYDLSTVVRECMAGYRLAYPQSQFSLALPSGSLPVDGSPDLAAQLLDKLVGNAVDFAVTGTAISVELTATAAGSELRVSNKGPLLPAEMGGRLFESMVSLRPQASGGEPHLGLGLYVARLIAEFHGGGIRADNLPSGDGVVMIVTLPVQAP
jgi:two-component system, OmpR family, sensor histidine kinase ChvG